MILVTGRVTAWPETFAEILRVAREHVHRSRKVPQSRAMFQTLQSLAADPGAMRIYQAEEIKF